jgi:c-di-GMP-binding flagellar brake protein YcgR
MEYQGGFETFKEATKYMFKTPSLEDFLLVFGGFFIAIGFLIVLPYLWSRYRAIQNLKEDFFNLGLSVGLDRQELNILWKCASITKEPAKIIHSKAVFERCISKLVKEGFQDFERIGIMRKKLRFDNLPWFLPLSSTRDIDLYQTGFITFEKEAYSSAVWGKNELEIHIALLDTPARIPREGDTVKFSFLREGDGRYYFQGKVLRVYRDGTKYVLVLEHTDNLSKIQLRDSLRWKVKLPAKVHIFKEKVFTLIEEPEELIPATIEDISTQGVRVCFDRLVDIKEEQSLFIWFELKGYEIKVLGTVKNVRSSTTRVCAGVKFENISKGDEDFIRKFIIEEQREVLRAYKTGELKEGSSS